MVQELREHYAFKFGLLSQAEAEKVISLGFSKQLPPKTIFREIGQEDYRLAYVLKGMLRTYQLNDKGEEITTFLTFEHDHSMSLRTILNGEGSRYMVQSVEETMLLCIDYRDLMEVSKKNPGFQSAYRFFAERVILELLGRIDNFVRKSPEERYLDLLQKRPGIFSRIAAKDIAYFLGVTPVSLSRLRKRVQQKS
ncbi:MAG: Crp/Fnr family transcriptional regulator [Bacteroidia bacterium]|nr:Crp/Fnr family transcriptional regulator [Bacteroidia bacterium]